MLTTQAYPSMAVGLLFLIVFYFGIGVPIGAVILRAAISLANRWLSPAPAGHTVEPGDNNDSISVPSSDDHARRDLSNPFSAPSSVSDLASSTAAIPRLTFGRAYIIALVQAIIGAMISIVFGAGFLMGGTAGERLIGVVLLFLITSAMITALVPTTFLRGMLVTALSYLIILVIAVLVGGFVLVISLA